MASITNLPVEVLEQILTNKKLSVEDLVNFSSSNRYFRYVVNTNTTIWRQKFLNTWPFLGKFLNKNDDYLHEFMSIYELRRTFEMWLVAMPSKFYDRDEIMDSEMSEWTWVFEQRPHVYQYLVIYLTNIINNNASINSVEQVELRLPGNLTLKHHARKVLRFVRQMHLTMVVDRFSEQPMKERLLEHTAVIVSQWFQPFINITHKDISERLDNLTELVKDHLLSTKPTHPIANVTPEQFSTWKLYNLNENQWSFDECCKIFTSMNYVFYVSLEMHVRTVVGCDFEDALINTVLDSGNGLALMISIIYESVARRLGVRCEPLDTDGRISLRFLDDSRPGGKTDIYYIDVFDNGKLVRSCLVNYDNEQSPQREVKMHMPVASKLQVLENLAKRIKKIIKNKNSLHLEASKRAADELLLVLCPLDRTYKFDLASIFVHGGVGFTAVSTYLTEGPHNVTPEDAESFISNVFTPKTKQILQTNETLRLNNPLLFGRNETTNRTNELKYAVGMVMIHKTLRYRCVIFNWDLGCLSSYLWVSNHGLRKLKHGRRQPFYSVLLPEGTDAYVPQEHLEPLGDLQGPLDFANTLDIGRYFSHAFFDHFVPNHEKEMEYPSDKHVRQKFFHQALIKAKGESIALEEKACL